jgi:hypothetical protein
MKAAGYVMRAVRASAPAARTATRVRAATTATAKGAVAGHAAQARPRVSWRGSAAPLTALPDHSSYVLLNASRDAAVIQRVRATYSTELRSLLAALPQRTAGDEAELISFVHHLEANWGLRPSEVKAVLRKDLLPQLLRGCSVR